MVAFEPISAQVAASLRGAVVGTETVRVQLAPLVRQILGRICFHEIVERFCGDDGDLPAWKAFEAFIQSRIGSHKPVPLSQLEGWVEETVLSHLLDAPAENFNEYRVGRVLASAGAAPRGLWIELLGRAHKEYSFDLSWGIYDISSVYFEGEYSDSELQLWA